MRLLAALMFGLILGEVALAQSAGPASTAGSGRRPMTFADLQRMKRLSDPQISPGGGWVMFSAVEVDLEKNTKVSHLWVVPLDGKASEGVAGTDRQMTFWKEGETGGRFSPDGRQVSFVSSESGSGLSEIYLAPWDEAAGKMGAPKRLTNVSTEAEGAVWSPDSQRILFVSRVYPECSNEENWLHEDFCNKRKDEAAAKNPVKAMVFDKLLYRHWNSYVGPKRSHVLVVSATDGNAVRDLTPRREIGDAEAPTFSLGGPVGYAWAPDSKEIAYVTNLDLTPATSTNNDVFTLRLDETGAKPVKISTSPGSDDGPAYSPDGKWIAFRSQLRPGYESDRFRLILFDRGGTARQRAVEPAKELLQKLDRWVDEFVWAPDSKTIYFASGESGEENILSVGLDRREANSVAAKAEYGDLRVSPDGKTLLATAMTVRSPAAVVAIPQDKASAAGEAAARRVTHLNEGVLAQLDLPAMESFMFPGAGETSVQGFMIRPPNFNPRKKYPLKFLIHGGPQGAWGDAWSYRWNPELMAANGYVVVMVNPRGSTGYGQAFIDGVNGDWGGKAYVDLMKGLDAAEAKYPFIDRTRECALGASYGGYMANWILTHTNRFSCIVTHDGMFNPQSAYGSTEELWFNEWEFRAPGGKDVGQPWKYFDRPAAEDPFRKWSPMLSIRNAKTPTLVIHSQRDFRLDVSEGFQLFTALQRLGVPSKMLYFPDEGHWILKPQNSQLWYEQVNDWCDRWTRTNGFALEEPFAPMQLPVTASAEEPPRVNAKVKDQPKAKIKAEPPQPPSATLPPSTPTPSPRPPADAGTAARVEAPATAPPAASAPPSKVLASTFLAQKTTAAVQDRPQTGGDRASFALLISAPEDEVQVGTDAQVKISMKNISSRQLLFSHRPGENTPEFSFRIEVRDAAGHVLEPSAYARSAQDQRHEQNENRMVDYIQPGGSVVQTAHLTKLVTLSRPGRYTVRVYRRDPESNAMVSSNELTLSIVP